MIPSLMQDPFKGILTPSPVDHSIEQFMLKNEFYLWVPTNGNFDNEELMNAIASNFSVFSRVGRQLFHRFTNTCVGYSTEKANRIFDETEGFIENNGWATGYSQLVRFGFNGSEAIDDHSPANEVIHCKKLYDLKLRGFSLNDQGKFVFNANIFVRYALTRMRLVILYATGEYYIYHQSGVWKNIREEQLGKLLRDILHEADPNIWKKKYQTEYLAAIKLETNYIEELNSHHNYININNGMYDIRSFTLKEHNPDYFSTIRLPINYNVNATCPKFMKFLSDIFEGDQECIDLTQEAIGVGMSLENKLQEAFFFYGTGSNGKSTLINVITHLFGKENIASVSLSSLCGRFGFQNLPNKIANFSTENELTSINTQNFKAITGNDSVEIERKHKDSYTAKLFCTLYLLFNTLPDTKDFSYAYFRRICLIPFNVSFSRNERNTNLEHELLEELDGIFMFALEGLKRLINNNYQLTSSSVSMAALSQYQLGQNPTIEFFDDCIEVTEDGSIKQPDVHKTFIEWARSHGYDRWWNLSSQRFWDLLRPVMKENGIDLDTKKIQGTIYINGIRLREGYQPNPNIVTFP
ncbi:DNA primase family protein [Niallia nealsonii]|uniref:SF3 helicase domain-containing protein n=1 Tax=Niallia nealsonii TaxID=115979 RepID=A0A2N0Z432_9BACI|nr:phage/plasmid primase, P4 family [Niallia nealsonii]PKG24277.1 hypothetical protein CWS01_07765 [Niallia nealsonii]